MLHLYQGVQSQRTEVKEKARCRERAGQHEDPLLIWLALGIKPNQWFSLSGFEELTAPQDNQSGAEGVPPPTGQRLIPLGVIPLHFWVAHAQSP